MNLKKFKLVSKVLMLIFISVIALTGCKGKEGGQTPDEPNNNNNQENQNQQEVKVETTVQTYNILVGTEHETPVFIFTSNVEGPRVAIVGGIHGDETAGWKTAMNFLDKENYYRGTVMIIPKAYKKADDMINRYPGYTANNGATYKKSLDLNRNFPGKADGTETQQIAYAICQEVTNFDPKYIIDLHESRRSVTDSSPLLGDLLIYGNTRSSLFCDEIAYEFNQTCKLPGEVSFGTDQDAPGGAFNQYFGETYPNKIVFTVETNRQLIESRRIEQQTQILEIFFKTIWSE